MKLAQNELILCKFASSLFFDDPCHVKLKEIYALVVAEQDVWCSIGIIDSGCFLLLGEAFCNVLICLLFIEWFLLIRVRFDYNYSVFVWVKDGVKWFWRLVWLILLAETFKFSVFSKKVLFERFLASWLGSYLCNFGRSMSRGCRDCFRSTEWEVSNC